MTTRPSPRLITIDGYTGNTEPTGDQIFGRVRRELTAQYPDGADEDTYARAGVALLHRYLTAHMVAQYHNQLTQLTITYQLAQQAARRAVMAVDDAYTDLSRRTTTAWHAAHHRYVIAVTEAQAAYAAQLEAAAPLTEHITRGFTGETAARYTTLVPADHQLTNRRPDLGEVLTAQAQFIEQNRVRLQLLAHTITGQPPAGLEPEHTPAAPHPRERGTVTQA